MPKQEDIEAVSIRYLYVKKQKNKKPLNQYASVLVKIHRKENIRNKMYDIGYIPQYLVCLAHIALMSSILHHTNLSNNVGLHSVLSSDVPQGPPRATGVNLYLGPHHVTSELGGATRGLRWHAWNAGLANVARNRRCGMS